MRFWLKKVAVLALVVCPTGAWAKSAATARKDSDSRRTVAVSHGRAKEARGGSAEQDPTDAELMLDAVNKWRGETPDAAKIEKISAEARADAKREQITLSGTWKDPFAEDPDRPIPVRRVAGKAKGLAAVRRELARARAETAAAQADAATAHADAAKAKANVARVAAAAAWVQAVAAKHEATAARAACVDPGLRRRDAPVQASRSMQPPSRDETDSFAPPKRHARAAHAKGHGFASGAGLVQASSTGDAVPAAPPPPPAEVAPEAPPPAPVALSSTHGGILVVPITR